MKKSSKVKKVIVVCAVALLAAVLFACDTASLNQTIYFNADFSGSRVIEIELSATPAEDPDNTSTSVTYPGLKGIPYYRIRQHGDELKTYIENALAADSYTAGYTWEIEVDDSTLQPSANSKYPKFYDGSEFIRITFAFDNFAEYTAQMRAVASFGGAQLYFTAGSNTYEWEDPTLTVNVDAKTVRYTEKGSNTKLLYFGLWSKMVNDPAMVTIGTCYHPDGTTFTVEKGNGKNDLLNDGVKGKSLALSANGSKGVLLALTQGDEGAGQGTGNDWFDVDMLLSGRSTWSTFFTGPVTAEGNTVTYTGGNPDFRWYVADADGNPVGDALTTAAAYTHVFAAGETSKKIVGVDGSARYIKTVTYAAPTARTWTVTFLDWDDAVLGTVTVNDGESVPQSAVPANPGMRDDGKVFKEWEGGLDNITEDTTVRAVYGDPADSGEVKTGGCGSVSLSSGGGIMGGGLLLLSVGALTLAMKRRGNYSVHNA
ncbi:MAG: hypothetical protein LBL66_07925 [Clostridiales bacterium]|jgi:hypothetical protein|nr:hypothetical protein [Clostridiales bacterium]